MPNKAAFEAYYIKPDKEDLKREEMEAEQSIYINGVMGKKDFCFDFLQAANKSGPDFKEEEIRDKSRDALITVYRKLYKARNNDSEPQRIPNIENIKYWLLQDRLKYEKELKAKLIEKNPDLKLSIFSFAGLAERLGIRDIGARYSTLRIARGVNQSLLGDDEFQLILIGKALSEAHTQSYGFFESIPYWIRTHKKTTAAIIAGLIAIGATGGILGLGALGIGAGASVISAAPGIIAAVPGFIAGIPAAIAAAGSAVPAGAAWIGLLVGGAYIGYKAVGEMRKTYSNHKDNAADLAEDIFAFPFLLAFAIVIGTVFAARDILVVGFNVIYQPIRGIYNAINAPLTAIRSVFSKSFRQAKLQESLDSILGPRGSGGSRPIPTERPAASSPIGSAQLAQRSTQSSNNGIGMLSRFVQTSKATPSTSQISPSATSAPSTLVVNSKAPPGATFKRGGVDFTHTISECITAVDAHFSVKDTTPRSILSAPKTRSVEILNTATSQTVITMTEQNLTSTKKPPTIQQTYHSDDVAVTDMGTKALVKAIMEDLAFPPGTTTRTCRIDLGLVGLEDSRVVAIVEHLAKLSKESGDNGLDFTFANPEIAQAYQAAKDAHTARIQA